MRFLRRKPARSDGINERWNADIERLAEIESDPDLTSDEKFRLSEQTMMRNNGGQPHGVRNVWTGAGEPPSGFGYYDMYGRRNR